MAEIIPNRVPCGKNKEDNTPKVISVPVKEIYGITYFKLKSDYDYDYTKNCGLLGNEIDENFYFLRSNDIKTGYTESVDNRTFLVLVKVDDEEIRIDITDNDEYKFRAENGYIIVTFPDGHEEIIGDKEGNPVRFLMEGDNVRIVSDASVQGDGSYGNPIGVDLAYRTGTYAPADFYADLTCEEATIDSLPGVGYAHGIVTKENVSRFGALYTWDQADKLNAALAKEGRGWRLPSKEDWAKLLNWAEPIEEAKEHDTDKSGNFGCVAGNRLKSKEYWEVASPATKPVDDFGMTIYPVGVCPENYNTREPQEYGFTGLYKVASFWTSSICEKDGEPYVRTFSYGHDDVAQFTENRKRRLSIRLVRDIQDDFDIEGYTDILGNYIPVVLTTDGKQLWTSINVNIVNYDGYNQNEVTVPEEWKDINTDIPAIAYYELKFSGDVAYYDFDNMLDEDSLPSYVNPEELPVYDSIDDVPEPTTASSEFIAVNYIIKLDVVTEAKFFYNAWDGNQWHKKLMREGESVVLLYEDYDTGCDTAATQYVTSANTNHEWRIYVNSQTGLDELIDFAEALKKEMGEEFKKIWEAISGLTEDLDSLSGFVGDMYDEMQSGFTSAFTEIENLQQELDLVESGCGFDADGNFIVPSESGLTSGSTSLREAIEILDDATIQNIEDIQTLSGVVEDSVEKIENIISGVGLDIDGTHIPSEGFYTSGASSIEGEIVALDDMMQYAIEEIEKLKNKTIEPIDPSIIVEVSGDTTYIGVNIDPEDKHVKIGEDGIFFDGDFKLSDDDDEDFYF